MEGGGGAKIIKCELFGKIFQPGGGGGGEMGVASSLQYLQWPSSFSALDCGVPLFITPYDIFSKIKLRCLLDRNRSFYCRK